MKKFEVEKKMTKNVSRLHNMKNNMRFLLIEENFISLLMSTLRYTIIEFKMLKTMKDDDNDEGYKENKLHYYFCSDINSSRQQSVCISQQKVVVIKTHKSLISFLHQAS